MQDLDALTAVEAECFPPEEAASREEFRERLRYYPDYFWLLFDEERLVAFVDGFATDEADLTDEMFHDASLHNEQGAWQMIFGVKTIPAYRRHGYAGMLIEQVIADAKEKGRAGVVLTCKEARVPWYASFGFVDEGRTEESQHGGAAWNQMRLTFSRQGAAGDPLPEQI